MKKSRLHQIIREEIHNVMNESIVPALYKSVPDNYAYDKFAQDIATFFKEEYGDHLVSRFMSVLGKSLKESVNEASNDTRLSGPFTGDELKKMISRDEETMFFANGQFYQATSAFQDFKDDLSVMDKDGSEDYIDIKDIEFAEATHGFAGVGLDRKKRQVPDVKDLSMINRGRAKAALKQIKTGKRSDGMPGPFTARLFGITSSGDVHPITDEDALNQYSKFGLAEKKL